MVSFAQQASNASFETWTNPRQPDGWYTFSSSGFINIANKDTTKKTAGNASAQIHTATISGMTTYELLSLGTADYSFNGGNVKYTYHPIYFPFHPDTMRFDYQYTSPGIDTATAYIKLLSGSTILLETEITLTKSNSWSNPYILLTPLYKNANKTDSLLIQFKSSKTRSNFFGIDGSTLNIDNLHFGYKVANSSLLTSTYNSIAIGPNPFSNELTISDSEHDNSTITLYNTMGQIVFQQAFKTTIQINTALLNEGIYFYEISNTNGQINRGKIVKE